MFVFGYNIPMQTFLPLPDFYLSAASLDYRRLGKQRVEAKQIVMILLNMTDKKGWRNHPAVKMWEGYEFELCRYGYVMCETWKARGYKDNQSQFFIEASNQSHRMINIMPHWFGDKKFHRAHQSNLIRKDPEFYGPQFPGVPDNLPYIWPVQ